MRVLKYTNIFNPAASPFEADAFVVDSVVFDNFQFDLHLLHSNIGCDDNADV